MVRARNTMSDFIEHLLIAVEILDYVYGQSAASGLTCLKTG
jgi:hypothetical protein